MGLFDFLGKAFTDTSADKLKTADSTAYTDPTDPRVQALITARSQGQMSPQEQANVQNQQVQAQNLVAGQAAAARGTNAGLAQRNAISQGAQAASSVAGQAQQVAAGRSDSATQQILATEQANRAAKINQTQFDTSQFNQAKMQDIGNQNYATGAAVSAIGNIAANAFTGGAAGAIGAVSGAANKKQGAQNPFSWSDKTVKKNIESGSDDTYQFLDHLKSWKYDYKDPSMGEGKQVSVMAQDLEKSPQGAAAVVVNPENNKKMVDYQKLLPNLLAANADMHQRVKQLESKKKE